MKRNLIGVAMTSLLIPAGLLVGAAPSGAASSPQPTISAVSAPAATSHSGGVYNGSTIGYADSFTFTVSKADLFAQPLRFELAVKVRNRAAPPKGDDQ